MTTTTILFCAVARERFGDGEVTLRPPADSP